jgi:hypothetical protein
MSQNQPRFVFIDFIEGGCGMTKAEIVEVIANKTGLTKKEG